MKYSTGTLLSALSSLIAPSLAGYTWPSAKVDEMEDIMYLQSGYNARGFRDPITPCTKGLGLGRVTAAEWVRIAFHDISNYDAASKSGGMDGSLMFETTFAPNGGSAFNGTFTTMQKFYNARASMADLFALGNYAAVRACGGPSLKYKAGRIDTHQAGPDTGPVPSDTTANLTSKFAAAGFDKPTMVTMTACGHSFGGVHAPDFPNIVMSNVTTYSVPFDTTNATFDNAIVAQYLAAKTGNPLVVGPEVTNSDKRVFEVDNNVTIRSLADKNTFTSKCVDAFETIMNTVPGNVSLTDDFAPIPVKPSGLQLALSADGKLTFSGEIRVLVSGGSGSPQKVTVAYKDRDGKGATSNTISTTEKGTAYGFDDTFKFYSFSTTLPNGISSFTVSTSTAKGSTSFDNGGSGFSVDDSLFYQAPQSCLSKQADANGNYNLTVVAAARGASAPVSLSVVQKIPQVAQSSQVAPRLEPTSVNMTQWMSDVGGSGYTLYAGSYKLTASMASTTFDVVSGEKGDWFKKTDGMASSCAAFD